MYAQILIEAEVFILPVWLELVDTATGTTQGGEYYTGTVTVSSDGF